MKYNLSREDDIKKARKELERFIEQKKTVELKRVQYRRTLPQNRYLHLLLGAFGIHFGYTVEEAKKIYKEMNQDIYVYRKKGRVFVRSSADLSKDEMAKSIDVLMKRAAEEGCDLPQATDIEWLMQIENEIEAQRRYL